MESFKSLIITTLLIGLCVFGLLAFIVNVQQDNNAEETILDDPTINKTYQDLYVNLSSIQGTSESQRQGFEQETPTLGTDSFLFSSIIGAGKIFTSAMANIFNIILTFIGSALGVPPLAVGIFISILIIVIIFLAWRVYKIGE